MKVVKGRAAIFCVRARQIYITYMLINPENPHFSIFPTPGLDNPHNDIFSHRPLQSTLRYFAVTDPDFPHYVIFLLADPE